MNNMDRLKEISSPAEEDWFKIAEEWEKEDLYLEKSTKIAVSVLTILRERGITKQSLAESKGVSAQYISKIVKGSENLTLETIAKLEKALNVDLVSVIDHTYVFPIDSVSQSRESIWDKVFSAKYSAKSNDSLSHQITYLPFHGFGKYNVALS